MLNLFHNQSTAIFSLSIGFAFAVVFSSGCYLDYPSHSGSAEVQGTVTMEGRPVNNAKVVFLPKKLRGPYGRVISLAFGTTDGDGVFTLQHDNATKSKKLKEIVAGEYLVIVSKAQVSKDAEGNELDPWRTFVLPDDVLAMARYGNSEERIPRRYNRETILTYKVTPSPKILRPEFKLVSADPLLDSADVE